METLNAIQSFLSTPFGITIIGLVSTLVIAKADPTNKVINIVRKVHDLVGMILDTLETKKKT